MIPARDEYFDHNYHLDNPQPPDFGHLRLKGVTWTGGDDDWMIALVDRMAQLRFVKMDIAQHTQFQSERWMITRADQNNKHLYNADDFIKRDNHNFDSRTPTSTAASFQAQEPLRSNSSGQVLTGIQEESKHRRMAELRRDVERVLSDLKSLYWSFGEPGPELADKLKKASSSLLETDGPWLDRIAEMRKRMKAMGSAPISDTDTAHLVTVGGRSKSDTDSHSRLKRKRVDWEAAEAEREALRKNIEDNTSRLLSKRAIFQADELFEGHRGEHTPLKWRQLRGSYHEFRTAD